MDRDNRYTSWKDESDLEFLVDEWHGMGSQAYESLGRPPLNEYLGLSCEEYAKWTEEPGWIDKKLVEE